MIDVDFLYIIFKKAVDMLLVIDNTKQQKTKMFLPKLCAYLEANSIPFEVLPGDTTGIAIIKSKLHIDGVIMSGSPLMLNNAKKEEYAACLYCLKHLKSTPILGICFGCQLINVYMGGNLHDMGYVHCASYMVTELSFKAKFCARYLPKDVPSSKMKTLMSVVIEGVKYPCYIQHKRRPLYGVMFHPEALKVTHVVLDKFLSDVQEIREKGGK